MTNEQINVAIAKACGVFNQPFPRIPDYCNDLNATHEAEKSLVENPDLYEEWLASVCGGSKHLFRATALQRIEALLRMIGKWEE